MPRRAWSCLVVVLLTLPLAACFNGAVKCPTCPPEASARIEVPVPTIRLPGPPAPDTLRLDSMQVAIDGGPLVTLLPGSRGIFGGLGAGGHQVTLVRSFTRHSLPDVRTTNLQITLARGEVYEIGSHNEFILVAWSPVPGGGLSTSHPRPARAGGAGGALAARPGAPTVGAGLAARPVASAAG